MQKTVGGRGGRKRVNMLDGNEYSGITIVWYYCGLLWVTCNVIRVECRIGGFVVKRMGGLLEFVRHLAVACTCKQMRSDLSGTAISDCWSSRKAKREARQISDSCLKRVTKVQ